MKVGIFTLTFIVFLVLKLCGVIAWSWWWVTAPLWIPTGLIVALIICVAIGAAAIVWAEGQREQRALQRALETVRAGK